MSDDKAHILQLMDEHNLYIERAHIEDEPYWYLVPINGISAGEKIIISDQTILDLEQDGAIYQCPPGFPSYYLWRPSSEPQWTLLPTGEWLARIEYFHIRVREYYGSQFDISVWPEPGSYSYILDRGINTGKRTYQSLEDAQRVAVVIAHDMLRYTPMCITKWEQVANIGTIIGASNKEEDSDE